MIRTPAIILLLTLSMGIATAQPAPTITGGPVNAASYARAGMPNAGIAQGAMFVLFGNNLGPQAIQTASSFPLQANLAGTSVQIRIAGSTFNALMIYTVFSQVAAIVPSSTPAGDGTVSVSFSGRSSGDAPIHIVANSFGIFTRNQSGTGPAIVFNFNSQSDQPVNSIIGSAQQGQVLTIWGTGLGAVKGDEGAGPLPGDLNLAVEVFIGNKPANIMYKGRSGCCAGIDQIVATVPAGVEGCAVSLAVRVAGVVSNFTTIAVAPGRLCSDPTGFSSDDLAGVGPGGNPAVTDIFMSRLSANLSVPGQGNVKATLEQADARFRRYPTDQLLSSTRGSLGGVRGGAPSLGGCLVYPFSFDPSNPFAGVALDIDDPASHTSLDAGVSLNINGPLGAKQVSRKGSAQTGPDEYMYQGSLGGGVPGSGPVLPQFLMPGDYTLDNGPGGADIGPSRVSLTIPSNQPQWTNADALSNVPRSQDLTLTWSGGAPGALVAILGTSADPKAGAGMHFTCSERVEAGQLTVPAWVLSALPATGQSQTAVAGTLAFASTLPQPSRFQPAGAALPGRVNVGFFNWSTVQIQNANFQ